MGAITSAPTLCLPTLAMSCLRLLMLHSAVLVKGPLQGSLSHKGSVTSLGVQSPRYLQTHRASLAAGPLPDTQQSCR